MKVGDRRKTGEKTGSDGRFYNEILSPMPRHDDPRSGGRVRFPENASYSLPSLSKGRNMRCPRRDSGYEQHAR